MTPLLPPNASNLEKALACAVQTPATGVPLASLWNPDTCPAALLPWLAWQLGVDNWSDAWSEAARRERIRTAMDIHRHKGTRGAVLAGMTALGSDATVIEWWQTEPPGAPHTFAIDILVDDLPAEQLTADYLVTLQREVNRTKPLRSHVTFGQRATCAAAIGVFAVARPCLFRRLAFDAPPA